MMSENLGHAPGCGLVRSTLAIVCEMLDEVHLNYDRTPEHVTTSVNCGSVTCTFWFQVNGPELGLFVIIPVDVTPLWRRKVALAMNDINWKLLVGNFELGSETGEMRFRTTLPIHGVIPTAEQVQCLYFSAFTAVFKYGLALIESGLTDHENDWLIGRAEENFREYEAGNLEELAD